MAGFYVRIPSNSNGNNPCKDCPKLIEISSVIKFVIATMCIYLFLIIKKYSTRPIEGDPPFKKLITPVTLN